MAKKKTTLRVRGGKFADEKYLGSEPIMSAASTEIDYARAYSWYNYFYSAKEAKDFLLSYLRSVKYDRTKLKAVAKLPDADVRTLGWLSRLIASGGVSEVKVNSLIEKLEALLKSSKPIEVEIAEETPKAAAPTLSIAERMVAFAGTLIADIDDAIDAFLEKDEAFSIADFFRTKDVKPKVAEMVAKHYNALYSELHDAVNGTDKDLKEAYKIYKKPKLKAFLELIKSIIQAAQTRQIVAKAARKPRKRKEKPLSVQVAKVKVKVEDTELGIKSTSPTEIIGAQQVWLFNTKYRKLTVLNAMGPAGLSIKGTTILGFDEKTAVTKKLRKPKDQLNKLLGGGKIILRKFMDEIKCKPSTSNGRLNMETLIVRVIK